MLFLLTLAAWAFVGPGLALFVLVIGLLLRGLK